MNKQATNTSFLHSSIINTKKHYQRTHLISNASTKFKRQPLGTDERHRPDLTSYSDHHSLFIQIFTKHLRAN